MPKSDFSWGNLKTFSKCATSISGTGTGFSVAMLLGEGVSSLLGVYLT